MLDKVKIGRRIQIALGSVLLVLMVLAFSAAASLRQVADSYGLMQERENVAALHLAHYRVDLQNAWVDLILAAASKDATEWESWLTKADTRLASTEKSLSDAEGLLKVDLFVLSGRKVEAARDKNIAAVTDQVSALLGQFRSLLDQVRRAQEAIRRGEGASVLISLREGALQQMRGAIVDMNFRVTTALNVAQKEDSAANTEKANRTVARTYVLIALATLIAGLLSWFLPRGVHRAILGVQRETDQLISAAVEGRLATRAAPEGVHFEFAGIVAGFNHVLDAVAAPVNEASSVLEKLAKRDLTARVTSEYKGDHARIKETVNQTAAALQESLSQVASAVDQVSAASGEIASSSQTVADGASQQASSLEETSSALESMTAMSKRTADNAAQANALAQTAKNAAVGGAEAVTQMSTAMANIKTSAEGTSQIIKDINEIAFQTNLLALNAAVEAARAGEAGRGFAVVAEEVRSLALRSKEAAMKTEELIRESVRQAGEGESMSAEVSERLGEIAQSIEKVTGIVNEISASAKEQSSGVDQINRAVADMNKVTQQNAANSEESSSAAAELSSQAEELAAMVSSFQLSNGGTRHRVTAPSTKNKRLQPVTPASAPMKPESVIPMDGDPAFQDF